MTKKEFLKKHGFNDGDWNNLIRFKLYEEKHKNIYEYVKEMEELNVNGGEPLVKWILTGDNYEEFLKAVKNDESKKI